jgi:serine protease Do
MSHRHGLAAGGRTGTFAGHLPAFVLFVYGATDRGLFGASPGPGRGWRAVPWLLALLPLSATAQDPARGPVPGQAAAVVEQAVISAIAAAERSVVAIARGQVADGDAARLQDPAFIPQEYASGVVVDRQGLILTNYHVLGDPADAEYVVWLDGQPYRDVSIKAADPWSDLAILQIEATDLAEIPLGDASRLQKGSIVIALGNPHGTARDGRPSASWGIVANLGRKVDGPLADPQLRRSVDLADRETRYHFGGLIQTDTRLALGTSGGPLLNLRGEMVGLTTSLAALAGYERSTGYAIPVDDTFRRILGQLKLGQEVEYGFLGVEARNRPADPAGGVELLRVEPGTPADRDGLLDRDVILQIDGSPIRDTDDLFLTVGSLPPDHVAQVTLERRGRRLTRRVRLSKKLLAASRPVIAQSPPPRWRGLVVDYASAWPRQGLAPPADAGVVVESVRRDSPAWQAGIRPGTFLSHVDDQPVQRPADFHRLVTGRPGAVTLRRTPADDGEVFYTVAPEPRASTP